MSYPRLVLGAFLPVTLTVLVSVAAFPAALAAPKPPPAARRTAAAAAKPVGVPTPSGWVLTFDDEFISPTLDTTKWTATDWASTINNEQQDYAPGDVLIHDGALRLATRKRARDGRDYTSGEVRSVGKFSQLYGRFEFRARLPQTAGTWSAEYLIAENDHWPPEIDVEEFLGKDPHVLHMTTHWAGRDGRHGSFHDQRSDKAADYTQWHVYTVEWEPGVVRWYFDGALQATSAPSARRHISHVPMYLRINTAIGGWAGGADSTSILPQFHDIDWVRVYRRKEAPPPVNAGPDVEISSTADAATLVGISCNPMGPHIASWSQVAGAGQATFANPHALDTTVRFPVPGLYRLRLTVADGPAHADSDMTVYVDNPQDTLLTPQADAYTFVNSTHPGLHADGAASDLLVGVRPSIDDTHDQLQSYLTFDMAHAPHASHATLRIYGGQVYTTYAEPMPCVVKAVAGPAWDEKSTDWSAAPTLGAPVASLNVLPYVHNSTDKWYDIDVTAAVQASQAAGQSTVGFCLLPATEGGDVSATFHSRTDTAHAPHLIITP